ncbi:PWWP domain-containing protein [Mycena venus]|uniref:PWWP domain-containing protein n=1 Tax=Mycena venus TaxID=2733690 RepID=A0A8H6Z9Y4_9AGAR|nr:PWWP domain-containing protein [Mycena venus]
MLEILHFTDVYTAVCMTRVNRHFRAITLTKNLWTSFARDFVSPPIPSVPTLDSELLPQYSTGDLIDFVKVRVGLIKVRRWRHKLQKEFLSNTMVLPKEKEMPLMNDLFTIVEGYQNMTVEHLMFTKIGTVMRHIHRLEPAQVPRNDEFKFRDRARALVDKWRGLLNANVRMNYVAPNVNASANNGE